MTFEPHGKHLIAGVWTGTAHTFRSAPATGASAVYCIGTPALVDQACQAAEAAFDAYSHTTRQQRAVFLRAIADEIEARADDITETGSAETGLPAPRLVGERGRTVAQLRYFADHIETGDYLDRRHDKALPDRQPAPRPDLRLMQLPIGPIAVFGASNFPLAFSVAGGDTAAALAAGCPVVVKGHSAHPGTGELVAEAVLAATRKCDMPAGVFSLVQGGNRDVGQALVQHPLIKAVGFTGSLVGGSALFDLCAARPEPIPFFGELGSVNPMFLLPAALEARGTDIAQGWIASLAMGAGQFCTNPGIAVVVRGAFDDRFTAAAVAAVRPIGAQTMLTDGIAAAYRKGRDHIAGVNGVQHLAQGTCGPRSVTPDLFSVSGEEWLCNPALREEVFGPLGLIVQAADPDEMLAIARGLQGQLTCTLHLDDADTQFARSLIRVLEHKAGRLLANGFPTGVEVCDAMVHGGPYPASTNFGATSVGSMSIRRFLRPVSYQNMPETVLPADLF